MLFLVDIPISSLCESKVQATFEIVDKSSINELQRNKT